MKIYLKNLILRYLRHSEVLPSRDFSNVQLAKFKLFERKIFQKYGIDNC